MFHINQRENLGFTHEVHVYAVNRRFGTPCFPTVVQRPSVSSEVLQQHDVV
jgi:hypothetical protein